MQIKRENLSVLGYTNGFTLWHYISDVPFKTITGAGYFDLAADALRAGDVILAATKSHAGFLFVKGIDAGSVITTRLNYRVA
jgi:hypothetical protein